MPAWLIKILLPILIELIGNLESQTNNAEVLAQLSEMRDQLEEANFVLSYGVVDDGGNAQGIVDWVWCIDFKRLFAALKEIVDVISDARNQCPSIGEAESE